MQVSNAFFRSDQSDSWRGHKRWCKCFITADEEHRVARGRWREGRGGETHSFLQARGATWREKASVKGFNKTLGEWTHISPLNRGKSRWGGEARANVHRRSKVVFMSHHKAPGRHLLICKVQGGARSDCTSTTDRDLWQMKDEFTWLHH